MSNEAEKRDRNCLFKFKVGDRVVKRWKWAKTKYERCSDRISIPIGAIGIVKQIDEDGTIQVNFATLESWYSEWWIGASELDYAPPGAKE